MAPDAIIGLEQSTAGDNHKRKSFAVTSGSQIIFCQNILIVNLLVFVRKGWYSAKGQTECIKSVQVSYGTPGFHNMFEPLPKTVSATLA